MMSFFGAQECPSSTQSLISILRGLPENGRFVHIQALDGKVLRDSLNNPSYFNEVLGLIPKINRLEFLLKYANDSIKNGCILSASSHYLTEGEFFLLLQQECPKIKNGYELNMVLSSLAVIYYEHFIGLISHNLSNMIGDCEEFSLVMNKINSKLTKQSSSGSSFLSIPNRSPALDAFNHFKLLVAQLLGDDWFAKNITTLDKLQEMRPYLPPSQIKRLMRNVPIELFASEQPVHSVLAQR